MRTRSHAKTDPSSFAHLLISKLSAISGQCQLLREDLPKELPEYQHCLERLLAIQDTANATAEEIKNMLRSVDSMGRAC